MGHTHHYLGNRAECTDQALNSCKDYLGSQFDHVVSQLREYWTTEPKRLSMRWRDVRFSLGMIGIAGRYPVRAMIREAGKRPV